MRGDSGPPRAPMKSGASGRDLGRAQLQIIGDQLQHVLQHRHHALLVAFAGDEDDVACAGRRHVLALERQCFGDTQARAVEQREHRGVARQHPLRPRLRRRADRHPTSALPMRSRAASASCAAPWARGRRRVRRPCLCRCVRENARTTALRQATRISERLPMPSRAARRHEGAHILRRELCEFFQRRRAAEMLGKESQKLRDVAPIGVERLCRHPPLRAEIVEPALDFGGTRSAVQCERPSASPAQTCAVAFFTLP